MENKMRQMTLEEHAAALSEKLGAEWRVQALAQPGGHVQFRSTVKTA